MKLNRAISALELGLSVAAGAVVALYRCFWAGDSGKAWAIVGGAAALLLVVFAVIAEGMRKKRCADPAQPGKGCQTLLAASGFVLVLSAVLFWMSGDGTFSLLTLLKTVFPAACGVAALLRLKQGDRDRFSGLLCLFPVFYLCFFLLLFYRSNGNGPTVRVYGFETAAIIAVLLGMYMLSAVRFDKAQPRLRAALLSLGVAAAVMELVILGLDRQLLLNVPGFSWGTGAMLLGMGLQLCAGLFCPGSKLPPLAASDEDNPEEAPAEPSEQPKTE